MPFSFPIYIGYDGCQTLGQAGWNASGGFADCQDRCRAQYAPGGPRNGGRQVESEAAIARKANLPPCLSVIVMYSANLAAFRARPHQRHPGVFWSQDSR